MPENYDIMLEVDKALDALYSRMRLIDDPKEAFALMADSIRRISRADYGAVMVRSADAGNLLIAGISGDNLPPVSNIPQVGTNEELRKKLVTEDHCVVVKFSTFDEIPQAGSAIAKYLELDKGMICAVSLQREVFGYLMVASRGSSPPFPPDSDIALGKFSERIAIGADSMRNSMLLKKTQEETSRVLSVAPIGIMSIDAKGIITSVNATMLKILDRNAEAELIGTSVFEIQPVNKSGLDALLIHGMEGHSGEKAEVHFVTRPDKALYLHAKVAPILSSTGEPQGSLIVAMDTSSKVRLENQLERSYEKLTQTYQELERVTKMKSQFIDVVSHELRTPLTVMRGYVELVDSEYSPKLDPKFAQKVGIIKTNTDKLYSLVESMLDVSRLEKGSLEIHPEPVKVDVILDELVKARMKDVNDKNQSLTLDIDGQLPLIMADRRRLKDVFNNLLDNAIKYTQEGGKIQVGSRDEGKNIHVWVKDNGVGIPLENLGRVFDRFYIVASNDLAHPVDRIGLSLPISKGIVEAHSGRIWVESQVGKGSVFHVEIPKESQK
jgi:PAS domain S-box-containing protein